MGNYRESESLLSTENKKMPEQKQLDSRLGGRSDVNILLRKQKRVLLIEPAYKAKYPPLGLMKISTFHKQQGDEVVFYKGTNAELREQKWDIIYITTVFTYQWNATIKTIKFYQRNKSNKNIKVGGILASLLRDDVKKDTGITPHFGLYKKVDRLAPDYKLFDGRYDYFTNDVSIGHTTRGCINHCLFCAVPELEKGYVPFIPLKKQIDPNKKDLLLLDNNVLASSEFPRIIKEIKRYGFYKGAKFEGRLRYIDFNQGVDVRLLTEEKMRLLSELAIKPLRIAFDDIKSKRLYIEKIRLAHKYGVKHLSNFILFNYNDTPEDFYQRLRINIELNEELGLSIFSFPMRFIPLDAKDRKYVNSPNWTARQLRGIQCILHATHGVVGPRKPFFEKAFGKDVEEFKYIIKQPEEYIFHREKMAPFYSRGYILDVINIV